MSYQVLARKWRPKSFANLVGQEHVVRALSHALATGRLHHAWLFTGTRGVGKTTISRILAKALNCEAGVTAEPCGQCDACRAIDADRFPDYVEMDAASNRGVEDMAALLDKAVYAPVQGRYKVYMIDEVHMLTGHAFNAMLKTLEEPPEHVKFILATTDPQKIPVTVLSRCLQFNLKQMPQPHIVDHLTRILEAEQVPFDSGALRHIAKAAAGSMRDALSLLDQAIAHGAGKIEEEHVTLMLGTVGDDHLYQILDALGDGDVTAMLAVADAMQARSLSFAAALQALASLLHRIALVQYAPEAIADETERNRLQAYAARFDAEYLQLAYQIAIHGRNELPLAPDDYAGFTMTLLRLHAFRPEQPPSLDATSPDRGTGVSSPSPANGAPSEVETSHRVGTVNATVSAVEKRPRRPHIVLAETRNAAVATTAVTGQNLVDGSSRRNAAAVSPHSGAAAGLAMMEREQPVPVADIVPPWVDIPAEATMPQNPAASSGSADIVSLYDSMPVETAAAEDTSSADLPFEELINAGDWHGIQRALRLGGMVRELAQHCEWAGLDGEALTLRLSHTHRHLYDMSPDLAKKLGGILAERSGRPLRLVIEVGVIAGETPAQRDAVEKQARVDAAVESLEQDPFVRELIERFDATLLQASVKPL